MAYITVANSKKLIQRLEEVNLNQILENIYKRDIYFFSKRESANLKGIRELFKDVEKFVVIYYKPIIVEDSYRYVFPETVPAYHRNDKCDRLHSKFMNIEVPVPIQVKGISEVVKFRTWYTTTIFKEGDPKDYIYKLQLAFPYVGAINPKTIEHENSGIEFKKNYSLSELEIEIDTFLSNTDSYFEDNPNLRDMIHRYQKMTFLGYSSKKLTSNHSGLSDEDFKSFLRSYEIAFKRPVKERLVEYFRLKFNPDMEFKDSLLDKLGFKRCGHCLR